MSLERFLNRLGRDEEEEERARQEQARQMKKAMRAKDKNPDTSVAEIARTYGVNVATLRNKIKKAAPPALTKPEEARLLGYVDGLFEAGNIVDRAVLLKGAHRSQFETIKYPKTARNLVYVDENWLDEFIDRNPEIRFRSRAKYDNLKIRDYESFGHAVSFWEDLAIKCLKFRIFDAAQVWYLNETSYLAEVDGDGENALGSIKRYACGLYEYYDFKQSVITSLTAYSAAGHLLEPSLIFRAKDVEDNGFSPDEDGVAIATSQTEDGLRSKKGELEWMERFEKLSKPFVQPNQWRLLLMDATSLSFECDYYARQKHIQICDVRNLEFVHNYLVQPADVHAFTDMAKEYRGTEDSDLIYDDSLMPQGFYDTLSSFWGTAFGDAAVCRKAFAESGVFPVDMSKNEKVAALKVEEQEFRNSLNAKSGDARMRWELERTKTLERTRVTELIDERLSKTTVEPTEDRPSADYRDYLLLQRARALVRQQAEENELLRRCLAELREDMEQEMVEGAISPAAAEGTDKAPVLPASSSATPLGSKRTAPQLSPSKRRRVDDQCNVYGMV